MKSEMRQAFHPNFGLNFEPGQQNAMNQDLIDNSASKEFRDKFRTPNSRPKSFGLDGEGSKNSPTCQGTGPDRAVGFQKPICQTTTKRPRRSNRNRISRTIGEDFEQPDLVNHYDSNSNFESKSSKHSLRTSKVSDRHKNPGLKIISMQVMNAVRANKLTTYKEVAVHVSSLNENNPSLLDYGEENDASKR